MKKLSKKESISIAMQLLKGDGCTGIPDFNFKGCCDEHDLEYRTGHDFRGRPIERYQSDRKLYKCIQRRLATKLEFKPYLTPWLVWAGVRLVGWRFWCRRPKLLRAKNIDKLPPN